MLQYVCAYTLMYVRDLTNAHAAWRIVSSVQSAQSTCTQHAMYKPTSDVTRDRPTLILDTLASSLIPFFHPGLWNYLEGRLVPLWGSDSGSTASRIVTAIQTCQLLDPTDFVDRNYNECHVLCTRAGNVIETRQTYCVAYAGRSIIVPGLKKE
jgi:hypothetical protein